MENFFTIVGGPKAPPTPDWLIRAGVCPYLRGEEMWYGIGTRFLVRGFPPTGVPVTHNNFHALPENWGPIGEPTQVETYTLDAENGIYMRDQFGAVKCCLSKSYIDFLEGIHNHVLTYFHYPEIEEGKPQPVAVFDTWIQREFRPLEEFVRYNELIAFIMPAISNPRHFLTIDELTALPLFSGIERPDEEENHGY